MSFDLPGLERVPSDLECARTFAANMESENRALINENQRLQDAIRSSWNGVIVTFLAGFIIGAFVVLAFYNP